jgi:type II secretory pathway component PulF
MGIGLRSGVDILRLLEAETKSGNVRYRQSIQRVIERIRNGNSLSKAMGEEKGYFPRLLVQLVAASELGGRMDAMFHYMADYYDQLKKTRSEFLGQITWPLIQLGLAIMIVGLFILLMGIILPANSEFDPTGMGLRGFEGLAIYCFVVFGTFFILGLFAYGLWKNWLNCHRIVVPAIQRIPVLGNAFCLDGQLLLHRRYGSGPGRNRQRIELRRCVFCFRGSAGRLCGFGQGW